MDFKFFCCFLSLPLILSLTNLCDGANILFYFAVSGYSHRIGIWPVMEKLANEGHSLTFVSPYHSKTPTSHPNITDLVPANLAKELGVLDLDFIGLRLQEGVSGIDNLWHTYHKMAMKSCDALMKNIDFVDWVQRSSFDLVVTNALFNECGLGLVHKFRAKHIMYSPTSLMPWFLDAFGLPSENIPEMQFHFNANSMSFFQRMRNELVSLGWQIRRHLVTFPTVHSIISKGLELKDLPPLDQIEMNTSLVMTYTHPSEEYPRSLPPNFVLVGGCHCSDQRKPIPEELEEFIDSDDFILLSFGTYAAISSLPKHLQTVFFGAIKKIPNIKFIVKYNGEPPADLPFNAKTVQWIPQQDILAHKKIRAFIGHGGLLGTHEAIFHSVPMIVVPLFAEQDFNAGRAAARETAIALELKDLTEDQLVHAIHEIVNNTKYRENTAKVSKFFRDRPRSPVQEAVWWINYVLRHDDISHLKPLGLQKTWFERRMIDIWIFIFISIFICFITFIALSYVFIKFFFYVIFQNIPKSKSKME